jgi:hypothetical protein
MPMVRIALGLLLAAVWIAPAGASDVSDTLEAINTCSAIADGAQRLACYDAAAPKVRAALNVQTKDDEVTLFGLTLFGGGDGAAGSGEATKPEDFGKQDLPPPIETVQEGGVITEITVALADAGLSKAGREIYVLENGQVWRQKEAVDLKLPRNAAGVRVKIRQGALGAYYLSKDGYNKSVPVERIK